MRKGVCSTPAHSETVTWVESVNSQVNGPFLHYSSLLTPAQALQPSLRSPNDGPALLRPLRSARVAE